MTSRRTSVVARGLAGALALSLLVAGCSSATSGTPSAATTPASATTSVTSASSPPDEPTTPDVPTSSTGELTTPASPTSDETSSQTGPTGTPQQDVAETYVYYVVDTRNGLRLAREIRDVPRGAAGAAAALEAMISGPLDPDYSTTWNPKTRVLGVTQQGSVISVDLSADARTANVGSGGAALMVQQLVWTATDASKAPDAAVRLTIDGQPAGELWGVLAWDEPIAREPAEDVRTFVQIDTPREGAEVSSPVTVTGDAAVFEANVPWRVLDGAGAEVARGHTMTTEGMRHAPFTFTVDLPPGRYTVEISEDDPSGGAGGTPGTDTRAVTVVP